MGLNSSLDTLVIYTAIVRPILTLYGALVALSEKATYREEMKKGNIMVWTTSSGYLLYK